MRLARWAFAVALVVAMAGLVEAQQRGQQGGRQRGQQGRGQGGFGQGGLTTQVLTNKDLQAELKLTSEQQDKFKDVGEKLTAQQKKTRELFQGGTRPDQDKLAEIRKEGEKLREDAKKVVDDNLTADQKKRLKQIEVQAQGVRAFTNEENAKALNLTEAQQTKVKAIVDETQKGVGEAMREAGFARGQQPDREKMAEVQKKIQKLRKQGLADITDTLTADQQKVWAQMTGDPFDTSKLTQGFGFGGFGGNRPAPKKE